MGLELKIERGDGEIFRFEINDSVIDYFELRSNLSESLCIEAIERIKAYSGKKCVMFFGNCQPTRIFQMLINHTQFSREYFFVLVPQAYNFNDDNAEFIFGGQGQMFQVVDLFITQYIQSTNLYTPKISTKNMTSYLPENTKIVLIPNIYFEGYFPQYLHKDGHIAGDKFGINKFPVRDRFIDEIMENSEMNPDVEKILDRICDPDFLTSEEVQRAIDNSFAELKKREWICDLKISDYIEENFDETQLFYSRNHPINIVMMEMAQRILRFVGFKSMTFSNFDRLISAQNDEMNLIGQDTPIYPAVLKNLHLKDRLEKYWANKPHWDFCADFRDFQREYIKQCWAEKFTR